MESLAAAAEAKALNDGVALEPVAVDGVARMSSRSKSAVRPVVVIDGLRKTFNPRGSCAAFWNGGGAPVDAVRYFYFRRQLITLGLTSCCIHRLRRYTSRSTRDR
jgi:hypothetical protein